MNRHLHLVRTDLPATVCTPWCEVGDGHPAEFHPADQACRSVDERIVYESADVTVELGTYATKPTGGPARVVLYAEQWVGDKPSCAHAELTAAQARRYAAEIVHAADLIDHTHQRRRA